MKTGEQRSRKKEKHRDQVPDRGIGTGISRAAKGSKERDVAFWNRETYNKATEGGWIVCQKDKSSR